MTARRVRHHAAFSISFAGLTVFSRGISNIEKGFTVINITVRKLGGSAYVIIPAEVLEALNIGVGSKVDFDVSEGILMIRPAAKSRGYPIADLLQGRVGAGY